jgi:hypothetical protein
VDPVPDPLLLGKSSTRLHGVISQKTIIFAVMVLLFEKNSNVDIFA